MTDHRTCQLVLTRRAGQSIRVDGPAELHILELKEGRVRVSIHAPASTLILRSELAERKRTPQEPPEAA